MCVCTSMRITNQPSGETTRSAVVSVTRQIIAAHLRHPPFLCSCSQSLVRSSSAAVAVSLFLTLCSHPQVDQLPAFPSLTSIHHQSPSSPVLRPSPFSEAAHSRLSPSSCPSSLPSFPPRALSSLSSLFRIISPHLLPFPSLRPVLTLTSLPPLFVGLHFFCCFLFFVFCCWALIFLCHPSSSFRFLQPHWLRLLASPSLSRSTLRPRCPPSSPPRADARPSLSR